MKLDTYLSVRTLYYGGIATLILHAIPFTANITASVLDKVVFGGFPLVSIVAVATGVGAVQAYNRRLG